MDIDDLELQDLHFTTRERAKMAAAAVRGHLVTFYRNGDENFKGLQAGVSTKTFPNFQALLSWLNEKIPVTGGIQFVFSLPDGRRTTDVGQFLSGRSYVVSSGRRIQHVSYGDSKERFWRTTAASSAGRVRPEHTWIKHLRPIKPKSRSYPGTRDSSQESGSLPVKRLPINYQQQFLMQQRYLQEKLEQEKKQRQAANPSDSDYYYLQATTRPRMMLLRSNTDRTSQQKVLFNPKTNQTYEEVLKDMTSLLKIEFPPIVAMFTAKPPYRKVTGLSHLIHGLKTQYEFLACGRELVPLELQSMSNRIIPKQVASSNNKTVEAVQFIKTRNIKNIQTQGFNPQQGDPITSRPLPINKPTADIVTFTHSDIPSKLPRPTIKSNSLQKLQIEDDPGQTPVNDSPVRSPMRERRDESPMRESSPVQSPMRESPPQWESIEPATELQQRLKPNREPTLARGVDGTKRPYRRTEPSQDSIKIHIHGTLREFFVPRYDIMETDASMPDARLKLQWIYGYRGRDARSNLHVLPISGELVYHVGAISVVYDKKRETQRHYRGHNEDISCINMSANAKRSLMATGQVSGSTMESRAHIRIWDAISLETYAVFGQDVFKSDVSCVAFAKNCGELEDGWFVLAIDGAEQNCLSVWDWRSQQMVAKTRTTSDTVVGAVFHPADHTLIITFGQQHIFFWRLFWNERHEKNGRLLRDNASGNFESGSIPLFVTALTFSLRGDVITGDSGGNITVWTKNQANAYAVSQEYSDSMRRAHRKSVLSLCVLDDGKLISGGGSEIKTWDTKDRYISIQSKLIPEAAGYIRCIVPRFPHGNDGSFYIGTTNDFILLESLNDIKFTYVIASHSEELWAVATHPTDPFMVTAGYDMTVIQWDLTRHKILWKVQVEQPCLSVTYHPQDRAIAIGTTLGRLIVLSSEDGTHMVSIQAGQEPLDAVKYSPDGWFLAMGSHNSQIYIYSALDNSHGYQKYKSGSLHGHRNFITHLDWSKDSRYLQSVSGDYDLLFWNVAELKEETAQSMRDVEWNTQSCILGYHIFGAWSNLKNGESMTALSRSRGGECIAVGNTRGSIHLYRYPCTAERPEFDGHKLCSGQITKTCFSSDDRYLIVSGGPDAVISQWEIIKDIDSY